MAELMAVTVSSWIRPHAETDENRAQERQRLEASSEDYETAAANLRAQVPTGWVLLGIPRW